MKIERPWRAVAVTTAAACCIVGAAQTPALAHDYQAPIQASGTGYYYGRIEVRQSHHRILACDKNADGVGVWVEFYTSDGVYHTLDDANGSADPCGSYTNNATTVTQFRGWARNGINTGWHTP
ncbi:hypothetical protein [Symbioplanes lichenis]|uniref:hypothetical protein n=1 Tax=Symbioplanes lichenis TaxID=1629072 RepID=UPI002739E57E|nr:hypothetical protein [Actinoplanes lichenis]